MSRQEALLRCEFQGTLHSGNSSFAELSEVLSPALTTGLRTQLRLDRPAAWAGESAPATPVPLKTPHWFISKL